MFIKRKNKKSDNMAVKVKKNLSEDEKQKLVEYRKKYYGMRRNAFLQSILKLQI